MYTFEALSTAPEIRILSVLQQDVCHWSRATENGFVHYLVNTIVHVVNSGCRNVFPHWMHGPSNEIPCRDPLELLQRRPRGVD